jgi:hypothetical protein
MPYNPGGVVDKSGNKLILYKVNDDGSVFSTFTMFNVGHISTSNRQMATNEEAFKNETGDVVNTEYDFDYTINFTIMQTTATEIGFFANDTKNTYWGAYYRRDSIDGKVQEWDYPLGKITPQFNQASPGGASSMQMKYTALVNDSAITLSAALLASLGAYNSATQTVAAKERFKIWETT